MLEPPPYRVVVLGGSAGALDPIITVVGALPRDPGFAVVVVMHLDPTQRSELDRLLAAQSQMPVERLERVRRIEHDRIYVMPEATTVTALDGHFRLARRGPGPNRPIDVLLASLAQDPDVSPAAVILSGLGDDGTAGVIDLKASGGLVLVQRPEQAEHDAMPLAAINTGLADDVVDSGAIAAALLARFGRDAGAQEDRLPDESLADAQATALAIVQQRTGTNLGYVKEVNLRRRFLRRVLLQKDRDVAAYLQLLRSDPTEAMALRDDILIGVTAFFRDEEFVLALRQTAIPALLELGHDPLRIWVPACSTGEEVYTIAMLLKEAMDAAGVHRRVQLFGTDINEASIDFARAGRYSSAALENVPAPFVERAFQQTPGGYVVDKDLREMCVFAHHNLLVHAPFSGISLVSCRNLLIYLRKEAQQHVFDLLHYACRPDGLLLLGRAEAVGLNEGFEHAGAPHLYRKVDGARRQRLPFSTDVLRQWSRDTGTQAPRPLDPAELLEAEADRSAARRYGPPGFVVDEDGDVQLFRGDVSAFLAPAAGEAALALPRLLHPALNLPVRTALIEARRSGEPVRRERLPLDVASYTLEVLPLQSFGDRRHYMVTLQAEAASPSAAVVSAPSRARGGDVEQLERTVATLSDELEAARAQLKTLIAEFESANEELRTSNEEMLSANEELQSANEELQSAKQELESANQELNSLNAELQSRNEQLARANDDLGNLVEGIPLAVLLVDRQLRLRHFSPRAAELFELAPDSVGQVLQELHPRLRHGGIERLVQAAVQGLSGLEQEHVDAQGCWWLVNARPYRTGDDRIDGAVIALQDIDALKRALDEARRSGAEAERANTAKDDFLSLVSHELRAPLNVISGWATVLSVSGGTDKTIRAVETIRRHCQIQAQLIDDLLDVSRISSGRLMLEMRPIDFSTCVRAVVDGLQPSAQAKRIQLVDRGLQDVHTISGDSRRLQQIASNLIGNAIKFTPAGGRVEVALVRVGELVELSVTDTGIGIEAEHLPALFDRFNLASTARTREYGGLGLGLSIVRHLVEAHGGSVSAFSAGKGAGTRLSVRLPASTRQVLLPRALEVPAQVNRELERLAVLLVEDDADARDALARVLELTGAHVDCAASASEALVLLQTRVFDAVVSDIAMPGMDGYDLMRAWRQMERQAGGGRLFAIALSGFVALADRDTAIAAGFDDHLPKPVDAGRLIEKLGFARDRRPATPP